MSRRAAVRHEIVAVKRFPDAKLDRCGGIGVRRVQPIERVAIGQHRIHRAEESADHRRSAQLDLIRGRLAALEKLVQIETVRKKVCGVVDELGRIKRPPPTVPWKRPALVCDDPGGPGKVTVPTSTEPGGAKMLAAQVTTIVSAAAAVEIANTASATGPLNPLMTSPRGIEPSR
jgi:hypothetical protein